MLLKFLDSRDAHYIVPGGTLQLGSFEHYRRKFEEGSAWIGDEIEGGVKLIHDRIEGRLSSDQSQAMAAMGVRAPIGTDLEAEGNVAILVGANQFAFCAAEGQFDDLVHAMCEEAPQPYDACFEIVDVEGLYAAIRDAQVVDVGQPVRNLFEVSRFQRVQYRKRVFNVSREQHEQPHPLIKDERFRPQSEMRIIFDPRVGGLPPVLRIKLSNPERYFRRRPLLRRVR